MTLTCIEQRATIDYTFNHFHIERFTGWVRLSGDQVIARKIGGRNSWHICNTNHLIDITPEGQ